MEFQLQFQQAGFRIHLHNLYVTGTGMIKYPKHVVERKKPNYRTIYKVWYIG